MAVITQVQILVTADFFFLFLLHFFYLSFMVTTVLFSLFNIWYTHTHWKLTYHSHAHGFMAHTVTQSQTDTHTYCTHTVTHAVTHTVTHTSTNLCMHECEQRFHERELPLELEPIDLGVVVEAGLKVFTPRSIEISIRLKANLHVYREITLTNHCELHSSKD